VFKWLIIKIQRLRWTIFSKLLVSFGLTILILLSGNLIIIPAQLNLSSLDQQEQQKRDLVNSLQLLKVQLNNQNSLYSDALYVLNDSQVKDNFSSEISQAIYDLKQNSKTAFTAEGYKQLLALDTAYQATLLSLGQLLQKFSEEGIDAARPEWLTYSQAYRQTDASLTQLTDIENKALNSLTADKKVAFQQILIVTIVLAVVSILACVFLAFVFSFSVGDPLRVIKTQLDRLAQGDLVGEIKLSNRDELGAIALVINNALANLRRVIGSTQIGDALVTLSQELTVVSKRQAERASDQTVSLSAILKAVQELNDNASKIADNTVEVVKASNLTNEHISTINHITQNVNQVSERVSEVATETSNLLNETIDSVDQLKNRLEEFSNNLSQITQVNRILDNVAARINIIALNASIEAAGAGEYGDRFAIVARRVKELVGDTRNSTVQIEELLKEIQLSYVSASQQLEVSLGKLQMMASGSDRLGQAVSGLNMVVDEALRASVTISQAGIIVGEKTKKIEEATSQQKEANDRILTSLNQMSTVNQEGAYSIQQLANSTEKLDELALTLTESLTAVKIN
jgi:methyl-accepting chemotaxis protein